MPAMQPIGSYEFPSNPNSGYRRFVQEQFIAVLFIRFTMWIWWEVIGIGDQVSI